MRLIDADALKDKLQARHDNGDEDFDRGFNIGIEMAIELLDSATTVEYTFEEAFQKTVCENKLYCPARLQGEYVDISKLRLMTVEECAGHTIEYAMGWKACVEWIKKGSAE